MSTMECTMKRVWMSWVAAGLLAVAGCGETTQQAGKSPTAQSPSLSGSPAAPQSDQLQQPPDAQWTIICTQFKGPNHVELAKSAKNQLKATTGLNGFYVIHDDGLSTLYYGFYRAVSARERPDMSDEEIKDGERAQADLLKIRHLQDRINGDQLFPMAGLTPLEPPNPVAPAAWDLRNLDRGKADNDPTKAFYTLEIAIYKDSPLRKQAAVDSVKALRDYYHRDDFYFFHGKTTSSVCVGSWPASAVIEKSPERRSSDEQVLVMPQGTLPGMADTIRDNAGDTIRPVSLTFEPVDPTMLDTMAKFPRRSVNGDDIQHTYKGRNGGVVIKFDPSLVIAIPRQANSSEVTSTDEEPGAQHPHMARPDNGSGQLRSLGDGQ
jgi:hypothetical protein